MSSAGRSGTPRRVRVTSPRRTARTARPRSRYLDLDEQTPLGEVYVDSLLSAQRRIGSTVVLGVVLLVAGVVLLFHQVPGMAAARILGIPADWLTLAGGVHAVALLLSYWYVRAAERIEDEFVDLMDLP